jgi:2-dehydropantoate 2-reductase
MNVAVLGPGGVGGLLAGALERAGESVVVIAQPSTVQVISECGLQVSSVTLGDFVARPRVVEELTEAPDALIVATKAAGLSSSLERIQCEPGLVVPLLNGLDHVALLRQRFAPASVVSGTIRVEVDRPQPGVVVHTSPFLRVDMAGDQSVRPAIDELAALLVRSGIPARVLDSEPQVMWSKLVRLNALACTTSAYDKLLGEIRSRAELRADLVGAIEEACAAAVAEGALETDPARAIRELEDAHATLGSSMQRDIAAGRPPELDAIPGSVLRAAARHGLKCPTIEKLVLIIAERAGVPAPIVTG